jgi:hypothetical protein
MDDPESFGVRRTKPLAKKGYVSAVRRSMERREERRWAPASKAFVSMAALLFACLYVIVRVWFAMHSDSATEHLHAAHDPVVNIQLVTHMPNPASAAAPSGGGTPVSSEPQEGPASRRSAGSGHGF